MATQKGRTPPQPKPAEPAAPLDDEALLKQLNDNALARAEEYKAICESEGKRLRCQIVPVASLVPDGAGGWRIVTDVRYGAQ